MISLYMFSLLLFFSLSSVVSLCLLLMVKSLLAMMLINIFSHFSWYAMIMYLIYVGGVYVLLIFISFHTSKKVYYSGMSVFKMLIFLFFSWESVSVISLKFWYIPDYSYNLCKNSDKGFYLFLGFFLLVIFCLVSMISSKKEGYIR